MVKKKMSDKEDEKEIEQFFISQFSITQKEEVRKPEEGYIERKVIDSIEHKKRWAFDATSNNLLQYKNWCGKQRRMGRDGAT